LVETILLTLLGYDRGQGADNTTVIIASSTDGNTLESTKNDLGEDTGLGDSFGDVGSTEVVLAGKRGRHVESVQEADGRISVK